MSSHMDSLGEELNRLKESPKVMRLRRKRRMQGMRDHQSRNTNSTLMADTRNSAVPRKQGRNRRNRRQLILTVVAEVSYSRTRG